MERYSRDQPHRLVSRHKAPDTGDGEPGRRIGDLHLHLRGYSFAFPETAAYAASKAGLIGLTQALAAEFGRQGVRVNAVLPGAVETNIFFAANETADKQDFVTRLHALKRVAQPEEIARAVLYLASDDASSSSVPASLVDGGASITRTGSAVAGGRRRIDHPHSTWWGLMAATGLGAWLGALLLCASRSRLLC
jgi:NAD(P)-dependent dehydrogenase (short-subunit alcohol dehydrogenase family)